MTTRPDSPIVPLRLRGIAHRFGRNAVLRGVDLEVEAGEIVGLIGPNGAGKTTLLSIAVGLVQPGAGERWFGEARVDEVELHHRARLAYVAHGTQLYPRLSAAENVALFVRLREAAGATVDTSRDVLEELGLGHARDIPVGRFSRGMAQRLALGRALIGSPDLLLLDEPFTALDREGRVVLTRVLARERERGAAILLTSHDLDALAEVGDRAVLLAGGRIAAQATRSAAQPAPQAIQGFRAALSTLGASSGDTAPAAPA